MKYSMIPVSALGALFIVGCGGNVASNQAEAQQIQLQATALVKAINDKDIAAVMKVYGEAYLNAGKTALDDKAAWNKQFSEDPNPPQPMPAERPGALGKPTHPTANVEGVAAVHNGPAASDEGGPMHDPFPFPAAGKTTAAISGKPTQVGSGHAEGAASGLQIDAQAGEVTIIGDKAIFEARAHYKITKGNAVIEEGDVPVTLVFHKEATGWMLYGDQKPAAATPAKPWAAILDQKAFSQTSQTD